MHISTRPLAVAAAAAALLSSCGPRHQISGHLEGLKGDSLSVVYLLRNSNSIKTDGTVYAGGGDFAFDAAVSDIPVTVLLSDHSTGGIASGNYLSILAVPGEKAVIKGTLSEPQLSGSRFYTEMSAFEKKNREFTDQYQSKAEELMSEAKAREDIADSLAAVYSDLTNQYRKDIAARTMEHISRNPNSVYSAYLVSTLSGEDFTNAMKILSDKARNGVMKPMIDQTLKSVEADRLSKLAQQRIREGAPAPDFSAPTPDGGELSLSSLRGKYVMLDFWGSWCHWCIEGIPTLKDIYSRAGGKVEFLSIACKDTRQEWKDALEKYQLPWKHVINEGLVDLPATFAVKGYPTFIVISPEGTIEKIFLGESEEFVEYMNSLIK